jgi:L-iditol 2-dehydrogenase
MDTACLNYGKNYGEVNKGHRANGFTTDGGFTQYAVNNVNTLVHVPDDTERRGGHAGGDGRHRDVRPDVTAGLIAGSRWW